MAELTSTPNGLVRVHLLALPVQIWAKADDESKDLMREFTLIALDRGRQEGEIPDRLLALIEELEASYGSLGIEQTARLEQARRDGEEAIDLEYLLPRGIGSDVERLGTMMDEADEYCRRGKHLLSLASSKEAKAMRDWFLGEMIRQLGGEAPIAWPDSSCARALEGGEK